MPPLMSVVFSSHNGSHTLGRTLHAFSALQLPGGGVEFIAVDNSSTDETRSILEAHRGQLNLACFSEPQKGKVLAIELGISKSLGSLVIFTDDDVIPDSNWLLAYADAAEQHPDVDIFAGQIRPFWEKAPPRWLDELTIAGNSYGCTPLARVAGPIKANLLKGANFMVRRPILDEIHFRPELDRGEDTDFAARAFAAGHHIRFVPQACLKHIIRSQQIALTPVLRRYFGIGRVMEASGRSRFPDDSPAIFGYPFVAARSILVASAKSAVRLCAGDPSGAAKSMINAASVCGMAYERRRLRNETRHSCARKNSASPL